MKLYNTRQVATLAGVHKDTLLRWLREKRVPEPSRDRNGWRVFTQEEVNNILKHAEALTDEQLIQIKNLHNPYLDNIERLQKIDWGFTNAKTNFLTHSLHPYPAKYIPQIPNALIQELSSIGERILDPFCGSGTTLVEAMRLSRHAVGVDASPLACLISSAKTARVSDEETATLKELALEVSTLAKGITKDLPLLFPELQSLPQVTNHHFDGIDQWFDPHVISELSFIKSKCRELPENLQKIAFTSMSSIVVTASRQDSDTRYVRREKNIKPGDTLLLFSRALQNAAQKLEDFNNEVQPNLDVQLYNTSLLKKPDIGKVDLVVCSPPYPNAFSYHLYHRTRMLWLDMDQPEFKKQEIGSHRKYSSKSPNAATVDTFKSEMRSILEWLAIHLRHNRHACFVIGDSTVRGERIKNDELLIKLAEEVGFKLEANIVRQMLATKKSFNPSLGRIKEENIVILRNTVK